ncbi:hypothetical protein PanWU01x14_183890 [Parasponia andersonii]|uniref:Uncharacterized protein n=1 Tax=Parasponia andersonii TaxID=3476 RepID=A0A2P5C4L5_PARAD|nr:hypothetical protein PanWU01x14_183890 [Parasponia andersonii]
MLIALDPILGPMIDQNPMGTYDEPSDPVVQETLDVNVGVILA